MVYVCDSDSDEEIQVIEPVDPLSFENDQAIKEEVEFKQEELDIPADEWPQEENETADDNVIDITSDDETVEETTGHVISLPEKGIKIIQEASTTPSANKAQSDPTQSSPAIDGVSSANSITGVGAKPVGSVGGLPVVKSEFGANNSRNYGEKKNVIDITSDDETVEETTGHVISLPEKGITIIQEASTTPSANKAQSDPTQLSPALDSVSSANSIAGVKAEQPVGSARGQPIVKSEFGANNSRNYDEKKAEEFIIGDYDYPSDGEGEKGRAAEKENNSQARFAEMVVNASQNDNSRENHGHRKKAMGKTQITPDEIDPNTFSCPICLRRFTTLTGFNRHQVIHTEKYKCAFCHRTFFSAIILEKHIVCKHWSHTQEAGTVSMLTQSNPKFRCRTCRKVYNKRACFMQHIEKVHPQVGFDKIYKLINMQVNHQETAVQQTDDDRTNQVAQDGPLQKSGDMCRVDGATVSVIDGTIVIDVHQLEQLEVPVSVSDSRLKVKTNLLQKDVSSLPNGTQPSNTQLKQFVKCACSIGDPLLKPIVKTSSDTTPKLKVKSDLHSKEPMEILTLSNGARIPQTHFKKLVRCAPPVDPSKHIIKTLPTQALVKSNKLDASPPMILLLNPPTNALPLLPNIPGIAVAKTDVPTDKMLFTSTTTNSNEIGVLQSRLLPENQVREQSSASLSHLPMYCLSPTLVSTKPVDVLANDSSRKTSVLQSLDSRSTIISSTSKFPDAETRLNDNSLCSLSLVTSHLPPPLKRFKPNIPATMHSKSSLNHLAGGQGFIISQSVANIGSTIGRDSVIVIKDMHNSAPIGGENIIIGGCMNNGVGITFGGENLSALKKSTVASTNGVPSKGSDEGFCPIIASTSSLGVDFASAVESQNASTSNGVSSNDSDQGFCPIIASTSSLGVAFDAQNAFAVKSQDASTSCINANDTDQGFCPIIASTRSLASAGKSQDASTNGIASNDSDQGFCPIIASTSSLASAGKSQDASTSCINANDTDQGFCPIIASTRSLASAGKSQDASTSGINANDTDQGFCPIIASTSSLGVDFDGQNASSIGTQDASTSCINANDTDQGFCSIIASTSSLASAGKSQDASTICINANDTDQGFCPIIASTMSLAIVDAKIRPTDVSDNIEGKVEIGSKRPTSNLALSSPAVVCSQGNMSKVLKEENDDVSNNKASLEVVPTESGKSLNNSQPPIKVRIVDSNVSSSSTLPLMLTPNFNAKAISIPTIKEESVVESSTDVVNLFSDAVMVADDIFTVKPKSTIAKRHINLMSLLMNTPCSNKDASSTSVEPPVSVVESTTTTDQESSIDGGDDHTAADDDDIIDVDADPIAEHQFNFTSLLKRSLITTYSPYKRRKNSNDDSSGDNGVLKLCPDQTVETSTSSSTAEDALAEEDDATCSENKHDVLTCVTSSSSSSSRSTSIKSSASKSGPWQTVKVVDVIESVLNSFDVEESVNGSTHQVRSTKTLDITNNEKLATNVVEDNWKSSPAEGFKIVPIESITSSTPPKRFLPSSSSSPSSVHSPSLSSTSPVRISTSLRSLRRPICKTKGQTSIKSEVRSATSVAPANNMANPIPLDISDSDSDVVIVESCSPSKASSSSRLLNENNNGTKNVGVNKSSVESKSAVARTLLCVSSGDTNRSQPVETILIDDCENSSLVDTDSTSGVCQNSAADTVEESGVSQNSVTESNVCRNSAADTVEESGVSQNSVTESNVFQNSAVDTVEESGVSQNSVTESNVCRNSAADTVEESGVSQNSVAESDVCQNSVKESNVCQNSVKESNVCQNSVKESNVCQNSAADAVEESGISQNSAAEYNVCRNSSAEDVTESNICQNSAADTVKESAVSQNSVTETNVCRNSSADTITESNVCQNSAADTVKESVVSQNSVTESNVCRNSSADTVAKSNVCQNSAADTVEESGVSQNSVTAFNVCQNSASDTITESIAIQSSTTDTFAKSCTPPKLDSVVNSINADESVVSVKNPTEKSASSDDVSREIVSLDAASSSPIIIDCSCVNEAEKTVETRMEVDDNSIVISSDVIKCSIVPPSDVTKCSTFVDCSSDATETSTNVSTVGEEKNLVYTAEKPSRVLENCESSSGKVVVKCDSLDRDISSDKGKSSGGGRFIFLGSDRGESFSDLDTRLDDSTVLENLKSGNRLDEKTIELRSRESGDDSVMRPLKNSDVLLKRKRDSSIDDAKDGLLQCDSLENNHDRSFDKNLNRLEGESRGICHKSDDSSSENTQQIMETD